MSFCCSERFKCKTFFFSFVPFKIYDYRFFITKNMNNFIKNYYDIIFRAANHNIFCFKSVQLKVRSCYLVSWTPSFGERNRFHTSVVQVFWQPLFTTYFFTCCACVSLLLVLLYINIIYLISGYILDCSSNYSINKTYVSVIKFMKDV